MRSSNCTSRGTSCPPCRSEVSIKFNSAGLVTQMFAYDSMSAYADLRLDGARALAYFDKVGSYEYAPFFS